MSVAMNEINAAAVPMASPTISDSLQILAATQGSGWLDNHVGAPSINSTPSRDDIANRDVSH